MQRQIFFTQRRNCSQIDHVLRCNLLARTFLCNRDPGEERSRLFGKQYTSVTRQEEFLVA